MPDFDSTDRFERQSLQAESFDKSLTADQDLLMEQILENINSTPIGQVLKKIASLPEVRREKVLNVRQQLTNGRYDLGERLDFVLDKVLDDLTA
ncbi:MAG: hypothetical protein NTW55_08120 [Planctomycetota bacterium]|nr:hypothetical protein [Planctomycetota bacterium]